MERQASFMTVLTGSSYAPPPRVRRLTPRLQEVAIEQLNEVPHRLAADIAALKLWIEMQPHLRARTDDQFLLSFLRGSKFSLQEAQSKIDQFYTLKTQFPEYFAVQNFDMPRLMQLMRLGAIFYLPTPLMDEGPRIGILRMGAFRADKFKVQEMFQLAQVMQEIMLREDDYANVFGLVHLLDLAKISAGHLFQMNPAFVKKTAFWSEAAIPLRAKANHLINTPMGFDFAFNMMKPLLSGKQQKCLYIHGSRITSLHKQIPKKYLPKEYGGENSSIPEICHDWEQRILAYSDYFHQDAEYGTHEEFRIEENRNWQNI